MRRTRGNVLKASDMFGLQYWFNKSSYILGDFDLGELKPQSLNGYSPESLVISDAHDVSKACLVVSICRHKLDDFEREYKECIAANFYGVEAATKAFFKLRSSTVMLCNVMPSPETEALKKQVFLLGFRFDLDELAMDIRYNSAENDYVSKTVKSVAKFASKEVQNLSYSDACLVVEGQYPDVQQVRDVPAELKILRMMFDALEEALSKPSLPPGRLAMKEKTPIEPKAKPESSLKRLMQKTPSRK